MLGLWTDGVISAAIAFFSIAVVLTDNFRRGVLFFLLLCGFMSVAWVRMGLLWLGAAEAGIAVIINGIVMWYALGLLPGFPGPDTPRDTPPDTPPDTPVNTQDTSEDTSASTSEKINRKNRATDRLLPLAGSVVFMGLLAVSAMGFHAIDKISGYALYAAAGIVAAGAGFYVLSGRSYLLRRIFAFNVLGSGVFLLIISFAKTNDLVMKIPFFMVLFGLVVSLFASLLAVILMRRPAGSSTRPGLKGVNPDAG